MLEWSYTLQIYKNLKIIKIGVKLHRLKNLLLSYGLKINDNF